MTTDNHPYPARKTQVIHTHGTDREIGRQHGEQIGDFVSKGMVKFYYDFWVRLLGAQAETWRERSALAAVRFLIDPILMQRLVRRIPEFAKERVRGVADATGMSFEQMMTALVLPDMLPLLQSYLTRLKPASFIDASAPPRFGCSSFVSSGRYFLHGRNLDFPGVSYWDRFQIIQSTARNGFLKFVSFTTAGVPIGGITGVNEAQISVSLHQHYCRTSSLRGSLPFLIAEEILGRAQTLEEALDILKRSRVATSWAFIVTDGKARDSFVYECHPKACGIRRLGENENILAHSNFFQTDPCRPSEYATTARMNWDNYWRKTRLEELVREAGQEVTPEQAVTFVSDHFDRYWNEEKILNRTVSQVYNIQSLVLDPDRMKVWLAEGDCPLHIREYHEYDLGEIFAGENGETGVSLPAYRFREPRKQEAKEKYILSFVAAFDGDYTLALERVRQCLALDYTAEAGYVAAVLCLKLDDYSAALAYLSHAKAYIEEKAKREGRERLPPEYFEIAIYLARTEDLLGERGKALSVYREMVAHTDLEDPHLQRLARAAEPYTARQLLRVVMPYSTYIPFE